MNLTTKVKVKKFSNGDYSYTVVKVNDIPELEEILPKLDQIKQWCVDLITNKTNDLIHIKTTEEVFNTILKRIYFKCGKRVEKRVFGSWAIPMKKGNYFFEDIDKIIIRFEEIRMDTFVITFKKKENE